MWKAVPLELGGDRLLVHLWAQLMQPSAGEFRPSGSAWIPGTGRALGRAGREKAGASDPGLRKGGGELLFPG